MLSFQITAVDHCRQVESFIDNLMPIATRGYIQKLIKSGHVLVNGAETTSGELLKVGDTLTFKGSRRTSDLIRGERPLVDFLYEDDMLAIVNKEPGRSVHNTSEDTGVDLVLHCESYMDRRGTPCKLRPVNRLDRGTSGAVILAKSPTAAGIMGRFIREQGLGKIYLAVVEGKLENEGIIDHPLEGKESLTRYRLLFQGASDAVVAVYPVTGRMHQIRKHFSIIGHPVIGDKRYGGLTVKGLGGHALHAFAVSFPHPGSGIDMRVYAPLPETLMSLLDQVTRESFKEILDLLPELEFQEELSSGVAVAGE